jgi:uncharacterized protein
VRIERSSPEPSSSDVTYLQEWKREWYAVEFTNLIKEWEK